jgi:hypothetical protein
LCRLECHPTLTVRHSVVEFMVAALGCAEKMHQDSLSANV